MIRSCKKTLAAGVRIRALIVDDSVVIRRLVTHALEEDPNFEVVGAAANGVIALRMIQLVKPDVVTLDIEMPEMNGLETLREIRKLYPELVVIMFSTLSARGAAVTLEALELGANDYVTKAANEGSLDVSMTRLRDALVPKIKQFFILGTPAAAIPGRTAVRTAPARASGPRSPCRAVAIGESTGGPTALAELVRALPPGFRPPILIVQHMPPIFTGLLADRLQTLTKLHVYEGKAGMKVEEGSIYIAPGDFHMRVVRKGTQEVLTLDQGDQENSCRPAVDVLFRSVSDVYGGSVVAVILTGMGQDGCRGVEQLRAHGAFVIAQDEASSVVWGMPGAVVQAGLADTVVGLGSIVPELVRRVS